ncbi:MAG: hypothetical protein FWE95_06490 [Planctomycetaceae bacterium]|nr:hypothetical protein [Planctomycetaceae bacterium]
MIRGCSVPNLRHHSPIFWTSLDIPSLSTGGTFRTVYENAGKSYLNTPKIVTAMDFQYTLFSVYCPEWSRCRSTYQHYFTDAQSSGNGLSSNAVGIQWTYCIPQGVFRHRKSERKMS